MLGILDASRGQDETYGGKGVTLVEPRKVGMVHS
jgi:hypothetical protein